MTHWASGLVMEGTQNISNIAEQFTKSLFTNSGNCGIAIANESRHVLSLSGSYISAGRLGAIPQEIPVGSSAVTAAKKCTGSLFGTTGLLTFALQGIENSHLQILWRVPVHGPENVFVNVAVGSQVACKDVYETMCSAQHGELVRASDTSHEFYMAYNFLALVYMGDEGPCPLAVLLRMVSAGPGPDALSIENGLVDCIA